MGVRGKDENPTQRPLTARAAHGDVDSGQAQHHRLGRFRLTHLDDTRMRPLLLVDKAQELPDAAFAEIRLLAATDFDSRAILSVVFAGDNRLVARMRRSDLRPIASRIRQRLVMGPPSPATRR